MIYSRRGVALIMVLMLALAMLTISLAATALLPMAGQTLTDRHEAAQAKLFCDGALEEVLSNLNAGRPAEFSRSVTGSGWTGTLSVAASTFKIQDETRTLIITARIRPQDGTAQPEYSVAVVQVKLLSTPRWHLSEYFLTHQLREKAL